MAEVAVLDLNSTTTPALVTASAGNSVPSGGKPAGGRPAVGLFALQVDRAGGSSMTGVTFRLQGSRDGTNWVTLRFTDSSAATAGLLQSLVVAASAGASGYGAIQSAETYQWPYLRLTAQAAGADAIAGDRARGWQETTTP